MTRDGRVTASGLSPHLVPDGFLEQLTNIVDVGLNQTSAAALTADGRVIEFGPPNDSYPQPPGLTNVIALDVTVQGGDDDLDYMIALTRDGRVAVWGRPGHPLPTEVPGLVDVDGGWHHAVGLKNDGTLIAWGQGSFGADITPPDGLSHVAGIVTSGQTSVALIALPPQPPVLSIHRTASAPGPLTVTLTGDPNRVYTIESTETFHDWDFLRQVASESGSATFELDPTNPPLRMFRATTP